MIPLLLPMLASEYEVGMANLRASRDSAGRPNTAVIVVDDEPRGFAQAVNRGFRALLQDSGWDCVCVLAADLRYEQRGWLGGMREVLLSDPTYGFVGPSVKCGTSPQRTGTRGMPQGYEVVRRLNYTGVLVRREVLETVGLLDERFAHYGCDYDHVHRAQEQGWQAVWVHDVWCEHDWDGRTKYPQLAAVDRPLFYSTWTKGGVRVGN